MSPGHGDRAELVQEPGTVSALCDRLLTESEVDPETCRRQALAAKRMLRDPGLPSTLYLGVASDEDAGLKAHAWLRSGAVILTGSEGREDFTVVSTFA